MVPYLKLKGAETATIVKFDGRRTHWSLPYSGERHSVVVICHDRHRDIEERDRTYITELGFRFPDQDDQPATSKPLPWRCMLVVDSMWAGAWVLVHFQSGPFRAALGRGAWVATFELIYDRWGQGHGELPCPVCVCDAIALV